MLVLLNLVQHNIGVTTQALVRLSVDAILIIVREGVHKNVWLCARNMHAATTTLDLTALNLAVVALSDFEAGSEDLFHLNALNKLFGTLALNVYTHHLTIANG